MTTLDTHEFTFLPTIEFFPFVQDILQKNTNGVMFISLTLEVTPIHSLNRESFKH